MQQRQRRIDSMLNAWWAKSPSAKWVGDEKPEEQTAPAQWASTGGPTRC